MVATRLVPLLLLLLGGHVGPRLSLPPLPEDPAITRMAPENPLWYFSWSGAGEPDPTSGNQTEQVLAEPEVRDFLHAIDKALTDAIRKGAPPTPQGELLGAQGPKLIRALLSHPTAAFVSKVAVDKGGTEISGGIVVGTGAETEELKGTLERLEQFLLGATKPTAGSLAAAKWHEIPVSEGFPAIEWGFRGKYLIVAFGDQSAEEIWNRRDGQPPVWLATIKKKLPVERISTVHYIDVTKAVGELSPTIISGHVRNVLDAFGVEMIVQFASVSGLEGTGYVSKTWIRTHGSPDRFWTALGQKPLTAVDLAPIPKDASIAFVARVQPARLFANITAAAYAVDAEAAARLYLDIRNFEAESGIRLMDDVLEALGDTCCVYNSPNEGGLLVTGLTIVVPLANHDRLVKTNEKFIKRLREAHDPNVGLVPFTLIESNFKKQNIYCLVSPDDDLLARWPAWCITDKQLIVSLSPQSIRAYLSRDPAAGSLADLPAVAERLKKNSPVLLGYEDTAGMLKITYPLLQMVASSACKGWQQDGLDLDSGVIPSLGSLIRHVDPAISTLTREEDGLLFVSRQSLPIDLTLSEIAAIIAIAPDGFVLPAF